MQQTESTAIASLALPTVPGWAIPRGPVTSAVAAAYLAGAALNSLDNLAHTDLPWAGVWRQRFALKCAAAAATLAGLTEDAGRCCHIV